MLAPKCSTYNGRPTFANPRYLKKAQSDKPCLYEIPFDTSDPANRFAPDREETMTLDNESRSKLDKDTVKPYDYTRQNIKETHRELQGKSSVETQFNKPSVVRQPNAQRIPKPSVLGKPTPFSNSPEMRSFQTKQSVNKTNVSDGLFKQVTQQNLPQIRKQAVRNTNVIAPGPSRNCPKHVSHQSPREKVGSNDMVHNYYLEKAKGKCITLERQRKLASIIECSGFQTDVHLGAHRKQMAFIEVQGLACPTCKKLFYSANHDECVLNYLSRWVPTGKLLNSCTGKVDSEPTHGSRVDIPHIYACKQTLGLSAGLVLHQMTSDHNRSELGIQDHSNEQSSSKLVPKVVP
ncbi:hypothetical protein Tco_0382900 [Tanacetum coccineum]